MEKILTWEQTSTEGYHRSIKEVYYGYLPFYDYNRYGAQSKRNHSYDIVFDSDSNTWFVDEADHWFWTVTNLFPSIGTVAAEYETLEAAKQAAQEHFEKILESRK